MNEEKLIYAAGFIDDDIVCEALDYIPRARRFVVARFACAAAAVVLCVGAVAAAIKMRGGVTPDVPPPWSGSLIDPNVSTSSALPSSDVIVSDSTDGESDPVVTPPPSDSLTPEQLAAMTSYDDVFEDFVPENPTTYGPPETYDELMTRILAPNPDHPEYEVDSYYLVEVIRALSAEEASQLAGRKEYSDNYTVYRVRLVRDLISGETTDRTEYVELPTGQDVRVQTRRDPAYLPGERFTAALSKPCEGYDLLSSIADFALRYDLVEDDGVEMLYFRGIDFAREPLDMPFAKDVESVKVTSTGQNPVIYKQMIAPEDLAEFMSMDWQLRRANMTEE